MAALSSRTWSFGCRPGECRATLLAMGQGQITRDRQTLEFDAPALLWLPPSTRGTIEIAAASEGWTASIDTRFVQRTASDPILAAQKQPSVKGPLMAGAAQLAGRLGALSASFEAMVEESRDMADGAAAALGLHLGLVILTLWRCNGLQGRSAQTTIERFTRLIELHYREHLRVHDYADRLGVSQAHLHDACLRAGGRTPLGLIHERLLEEARARLRQNECSVEQVGYFLGFRDPGYFNRFFKRLTGESPGAFQRSMGRIRQTPPSFASWP